MNASEGSTLSPVGREVITIPELMQVDRRLKLSLQSENE